MSGFPRRVGLARRAVKRGASQLLIPTASGQTSARNRRVEFVVLNPDVLRRESGELGARTRASAEGRVSGRTQ